MSESNLESVSENYKMFVERVSAFIDQEELDKLFEDFLKVSKKIILARGILPFSKVNFNYTYTGNDSVIASQQFTQDWKPKININVFEVAALAIHCYESATEEQNEPSISSLKFFEFSLISSYIHEQLHVFGVQRRSGDEHTVRAESGFKKIAQVRGADIQLVTFDDFNEAFVQKCAHEMTTKYFAEVGGRHISISDAESIALQMLDNDTAYKRKMWILDQFISLVATITDKPETEILNYINYAYVSGDVLISKDIENKLNAVQPLISNEI